MMPYDRSNRLFKRWTSMDLLLGFICLNNNILFQTIQDTRTKITMSWTIHFWKYWNNGSGMFHNIVFEQNSLKTLHCILVYIQNLRRDFCSILQNVFKSIFGQNIQSHYVKSQSTRKPYEALKLQKFLMSLEFFFMVFAVITLNKESQPNSYFCMIPNFIVPKFYQNI